MIFFQVWSLGVIVGSTPADHKSFLKKLFVRITAYFTLLYSQTGQCEENFYSSTDKKWLYILRREFSKKYL